MARSREVTVSVVLAIVSMTVVARQAWLVRYESLSRWKCGGFGMYSEPHYSEREVWANLRPCENDVVSSSAEHRRALKRAKVRPTREALASVRNTHSAPHCVASVEVWALQLTEDGLTRSLLLRAAF